MKVCIVSPFPPNRSGIADYTRKLVETLRSRQDVQVSVVTQSSPKGSLDYVSYSLSGRLWSWPGFYRAIAATKPDIIHLQYDFSSYMFASFPLFALLWLFKRRHGVPIVATYHEARRDLRLYGWLAAFFYTAVSRILDRVIVHTQDSMTALVGKCGVDRDRVKIVPLGTYVFPSREDKSSELAERYAVRGKRVLLFLGYIYPAKGLEYLLSACARLACSGRVTEDIILLVAGEVKGRDGLFKAFEWRNRNYLKRLMVLRDTLGLADKVRFIGYVRDEDLYSLLRLSDLVVLPYTEVDQSAVLSMALAAHRPVVATRVGGLAETLADAGVLVTPKDSEEIASAVESLLTDGSHYARVSAEYKRISAEQSTETVVERTVQEYREVVSLQAKRPKIVEVSAYFVPHLGGQEQVVKEVSVRLAGRGHPVEVRCSTSGLQEGEAFSAPGVTTRYLKCVHVANTPLMPALISHLLSTAKGSLLHVHTGQAFVPEVVYLVSLVRGLQYVAHYHLEVRPSSRLGVLLPMWKRFVLGPFLRRASAVICLTESGKSQLCRSYGVEQSKVAVVPNGVREEFFVKGAAIDPENRHVLFVGRLAAQKNVRVLAEAVALLSGLCIIDFVREGPEEETLREIAHRRGLRNLRFLGRKSGDELVGLYRQAAVLVLPSSHEGHPLVLLEAMASGVPVVASDIPEIRECVGEAGLLVRDQTPAAFASAIQEVLDNAHLRRTLAEAGIRRAGTLKWENAIDRLEGVFKGITDDAR